MKPPGYIEVTSLSAIEHILSHRPDRAQRLFIQQPPAQWRGRVGQLHDLARAAGIPVDTGGRGPKGGPAAESVRLHVAPFRYTELDELVETLSAQPRALVLALDHVQDPQNFGALCRSAEAFGAAGIIIPKDRGVTVTPGVYQASVGAVETLPVVLVTNVGEAIRKLKNETFWVVGASLGEGAQDPWKMPDFEKIVLVLGAELEGISPHIEKLCDWRVRIPIRGKVDSLNVSNAGAVLLYEWMRRTSST